MSRRKSLIIRVGMLLLLSAFVATFTLYPAPPAHAMSSACGMPTIAYGSSGSDVTYLQLVLNNRYSQGWFKNTPYDFQPYQHSNTPLAVDGDFGILTTNAVEDFQTAAHIRVDGSVGPQTWTALGVC